MPIEPPPMSTAHPLSGPGEVIKTERPCIKCGYNLQGLQVGGACPECGTAIANAKKSERVESSERIERFERIELYNISERFEIYS